MAFDLLSIVKQAVSVVEAAIKPSPPPTPLSVKSPLPGAETTRPYIIKSASPVAPKVESTQVTYGQQYQIQQYNSDGSIVSKTIPMSELQKNAVTFDPRLSTADSLKQTEASLLQGLHLAPNDVYNAILAGLKADYPMTIKSQVSDPLEINLLQTPDMKTNLIYNFYTDQETNISSQEDPNKDPFAAAKITDKKVPFFVKLDWDPIDTLHECDDFDPKTPEEEAIVQQYLKPVRGVSNAGAVDQNKVQSLLRQTNVLSRDGVTLELVDTHDLPTAFNSLSNSRIFKTSALTVMNTNVTDLDKVDFNDILFNNGE